MAENATTETEATKNPLVNPIASITKELILGKTVRGYPDNPSEHGISADVLKRAFYEFISTGDLNDKAEEYTILGQINRIVGETNDALGNGFKDEAGDAVSLTDKILALEEFFTEEIEGLGKKDDCLEKKIESLMPDETIDGGDNAVSESEFKKLQDVVNSLGVDNIVISLSGGGYLEKGLTHSITLTWKVTAGSSFITSLKLLKGTKVVAELTDNVKAGKTTGTVSVSDVNDTTTWTLKANNNKTASTTASFIYPYFTGTIKDTTISTFNGLAPFAEPAIDKTITYAEGGYACVAVHSSKTLTVTDAAGNTWAFVGAGSFTYNGQEYNAYRTDKYQNVSGSFKITISVKE